MIPFTKLTSVAAPLDRVNVDTDQIIPKQFLKRIERTGFGEFAFFDWRYHEDGSLNPDFELNNPAYQGAQILIAGRNFGCGSSREHAPWALNEYGIRAIIAPSFADIFRNNCIQNGMLPVTLPEERVQELMRRAQSAPGHHVTVDLVEQTVSDDRGFKEPFTVDPFERERLLNGLDDIGMTLQVEERIAAFEQRRPAYLGQGAESRA
jgi:3-isopropylmalate/(R)-2-methylmalate dehydratase small subunit